MNVAITRARRHLAIIGDSETISAHPFLKRLVAYMEAHAEYLSADQFLEVTTCSAFRCD
jgi:ATP-dependent RNA/DNA helicase IGHMBP2